MRPDRVKERLQKDSRTLTSNESVAKMVDLINLYHSIEHRHGTPEQKDEARALIKKEVSKLRKQVGTGLAKNVFWYLKDHQAWNATKESLIQ